MSTMNVDMLDCENEAPTCNKVQETNNAEKVHCSYSACY